MSVLASHYCTCYYEFKNILNIDGVKRFRCFTCKRLDDPTDLSDPRFAKAGIVRRKNGQLVYELRDKTPDNITLAADS